MILALIEALHLKKLAIVDNKFPLCNNNSFVIIIFTSNLDITIYLKLNRNDSFWLDIL
jgi:hypothetical protein